MSPNNTTVEQTAKPAPAAASNPVIDHAAAAAASAAARADKIAKKAAAKEKKKQEAAAAALAAGHLPKTASNNNASPPPVQEDVVKSDADAPTTTRCQDKVDAVTSTTTPVSAIPAAPHKFLTKSDWTCYRDKKCPKSTSLEAYLEHCQYHCPHRKTFAQEVAAQDMKPSDAAMLLVATEEARVSTRHEVLTNPLSGELSKNAKSNAPVLIGISPGNAFFTLINCLKSIHLAIRLGSPEIAVTCMGDLHSVNGSDLGPSVIRRHHNKAVSRLVDLDFLVSTLFPEWVTTTTPTTMSGASSIDATTTRCSTPEIPTSPISSSASSLCPSCSGSPCPSSVNEVEEATNATANTTVPTIEYKLWHQLLDNRHQQARAAVYAAFKEQDSPLHIRLMESCNAVAKLRNHSAPAAHHYLLEETAALTLVPEASASKGVGLNYLYPGSNFQAETECKSFLKSCGEASADESFIAHVWVRSAEEE